MSTKLRVIQTDNTTNNSNLTSCNSESLIVNTGGGLYLGNGTADPSLISDKADGNYLKLSGGALTGNLISQSIIPAITHTSSATGYNLGSSDKQFNTVYTRYIDTQLGYNLRLKAGGVEHINMLDNIINVTSDIFPTQNNTYILGNSGHNWKEVFATNFTENGQRLNAKYATIPYADYCSSYLHSANRAQFCKPAGVTIEYSTDSGSTWVDYGATDAQKIGLFSGISQVFNLGKKLSTKCLSSDALRITMDATAMGFYTDCKCLLLNISTNGSANFKVKVERSMKGSSDTFTTLTESQTLTGWSGWNRIHIGSPFGGGDAQTYNIAKLRLTFTSDGAGSSYTSGAHPYVIDMEVLGNNYWSVPHTMAKTGHIYTWDVAGNATFSKNITAATFQGNLDWSYVQNKPNSLNVVPFTGASNKYTQICKITLPQNGRTAKLEIITGKLFSGGDAECKDAIIHIRTSNGNTNINGRYYSAHIESFRHGTYKYYIVQNSLTSFTLWSEQTLYSGSSFIIPAVCEDGAFEIIGTTHDSLPTENIYELPVYQIAYNDQIPTKLSQLADDVVNGKYLPLSGTANDSSKLGGQLPEYYETVWEYV